jgi:hypothetical protein
MSFCIPADTEAVTIYRPTLVQAEAGIVGLGENGVGWFCDKLGENKGVSALEELNQVSSMMSFS